MRRTSTKGLSGEQATLFPPDKAHVEARPRTAQILQMPEAARPSDAGQQRVADPASVFLTALEVIARYGWGRTKGYRMLHSEGFPRPIGGDRYRLDTLTAWENAQLAAARPAKSAPSLPPRKRVRAG